jgi:uncharacterized protein (DUF488 family)
MREIFTIGYAPHTLDSFFDVVQKHKINVIADVRSSPYSKFKADFNQNVLDNFLKTKQIRYVFFGDVWGARIDDRECYVDGNVDFNLVAQSQKFKDGMLRIIKGMENFRIALMCAEKDPLTCHRAILISRNIQLSGIGVQHILAEGNLEEHHESELRLMKLHKLNHPNLFFSEQQRLEQAYSRQADKIAYEDVKTMGEFGDPL